MSKVELENCHDCASKPGEIHSPGCDIEYCSVCGGQWIVCGHKKHDPAFARWTGIWPGYAEAELLGINLNEFHWKYTDVFFIKPDVHPK